MTTYTLAGGCFWCLDGVYRHIKGVELSRCGYTGGAAEDADYYRVVSGRTGHAEAVQITFDENVISPDVILDMFFLIHDPTTKDRQGADQGPQYRSALFYADDEQRQRFERAIQRNQTLWDDPIVTELTPLEAFYPAEPEHQDYFANNPTSSYCAIVIAPKVSKARQQYRQWFQAE